MHSQHHVRSPAAGEAEQQFQDWFAVQTTPRREKYLQSVIAKGCRGSVRTYLPVRRVLHFRRSAATLRTLPMFPGYLFIHRDWPAVKRAIGENGAAAFGRLVEFDGAPSCVAPDEMQLISSLTDSRGVVDLSSCALRDDGSVEVLAGPLKALDAQIEFVNLKKRKVHVSMTLFRRRLSLSLGFNLVEPGIRDPA